MERGQRPLVSGPAARGTIEFLASLYKSAMTGQPVTRGSIVPGDPFYERMCGPCDQDVAALMTATIERVDLFPVRLPMIKSFTFASGSAGWPAAKRHISF